MIVHRVIDSPWIDANRDALCVWVTAHGLDPHRIAPDWIAIIEHDDGTQYLHFREKYRTPAGSDLVDPDDATRAWTYARSVPLTTAAPQLAPPARPEHHDSDGGGRP